MFSTDMEQKIKGGTIVGFVEQPPKPDKQSEEKVEKTVPKGKK